MAISEWAGRHVPRSILVNVPRLVAAYYTEAPQGKVSFGTSGHRGSSLNGTFNEAHIAATAQAISEYRLLNRAEPGPLFVGVDTHALSEPAFRTALEVFAANGIEVIIHAGNGYTPTPVISFLILEYNRGRLDRLADGVVITPSHNPPRDGGFKYNPPHGGPADVDVTGWVQDRANLLMENGNREVRRIPYERACRADNVHEQDFVTPFVEGLSGVIDFDAIRSAGLRLGADPLGGSGVHYWAPIAERYGLNLEVVNPEVDPTFSFMPADGDGEIRMDCSSPHAMADLIGLADRFDVAWGNDPDFDRHGIVTSDGLMNPNHYLSVAVHYLKRHRPGWRPDLKVGKTLVSSSMIDKVAEASGSAVHEVPVGFKWFVAGLREGSLCFGGEESAGASLLRLDGSVWTTDKDGFSLALLAAEITARTGKTPSQYYRDILVPQFGEPYYRRADGPISDEEKAVLKALTPDSVKAVELAGLEIKSVLTAAPGNGAPVGGVKVVLADGSWFAIRPSGTEPKMKVYAESFGGEKLWEQITREALPLIFG